jgi:hypothetical protein
MAGEGCPVIEENPFAPIEILDDPVTKVVPSTRKRKKYKEEISIPTHPKKRRIDFIPSKYHLKPSYGFKWYLQ